MNEYKDIKVREALSLTLATKDYKIKIILNRCIKKWNIYMKKHNSKKRNQFSFPHTFILQYSKFLM